MESEIENEESVVDDFVNLSVGKEKQNVLVAEDENEAELDDSETKLVHQEQRLAKNCFIFPIWKLWNMNFDTLFRTRESRNIFSLSFWFN